MGVYRKVAGLWEPVVVWRKVAGVWKQCLMHRKVGGTWKVLSDSIITVGNSGGVLGYSTAYGGPGMGSMQTNTLLLNGTRPTISDARNNTAGNGFYLRVAGTPPNSGWTSVRVGSQYYTRASGGYGTGGGYADWQWAGTNPFGAAGTQTPIEIII